MRKIFTTIVLGLALISSGCSSKQKSPNTPPPPTPSQLQSTQITTKDKTKSMQQKVFTLDELKKYNGQNGNPAYVAVDGVVYDVTNVNKWKGGRHEGNTAGNDLSKAIASSPHGKSVLSNLPVMGTLKQ